ncbi:hypothetical protein GCM10009626_43840 [Brachybacterium sacelli]
MIEKMIVNINAGRINGSWIAIATLNPLAPSIFAASYNSPGIAFSCAMMINMLYPVYVQVTMFAIDHNTMFGPRKSISNPTQPSTSTIGDNPGMYRNDHKIVAITPGIPYGKKYVARKKPGHFAFAVSNNNANTVAATIITVTCTIPNRTIRPIDSTKFAFDNAFT